jgi:hypothetical protein
MPDNKQQSIFVTVLAWIFIIIGGFSTFMAILQNVMLFFFFPRDGFNQQISAAQFPDEMPTLFKIMFSHFDLFSVSFLVISSVTFISAIALLKRKNWARIMFILLMIVGIVWNVGGVVLQYFWFQTLPEMAGSQVPQEFEMMQNVTFSVGIVMAVAFTILFGWIIKKLSSQSIVTEFV